jgi:hypothetical protein
MPRRLDKMLDGNVLLLAKACAFPILLSAFFALTQLRPKSGSSTPSFPARVFLARSIIALSLCESALLIGMAAVLRRVHTFPDFLPIAGCVLMINFVVILPSILSQGKLIDSTP